MASRLSILLDRLETRRASLDGYEAHWCTCCYRCTLHGPRPNGRKERREFVVLDGGDDDCRQPIETGTISDCINSLRAELGR